LQHLRLNRVRSFLLSEGLLLLDHSLDTVVHILNEVLLRAAETSLVGDVVGGIGGLGVLTVNTSDLYVELVGDGLELIPLLGELGESDVDGGAEGGSEVGGAGGDVAEVVVVGELGVLLDVSSSAGKSVEDGVDVSTWLHGDDTKLILLINPDKESLVVVVEDTSAFGPFAVETERLQESVSLSILNIIYIFEQLSKVARNEYERWPQGGTSPSAHQKAQLRSNQNV